MRFLIPTNTLAMAGAGCAHTQQPESRIHVISENTHDLGATIGIGGAGGRDCQAEHEECFRRCWRKSHPPYPHKHDEWYYKRCTADCSKAFNECMDEQEEETGKGVQTLEFSRADQAIEWIRNNKTKVMLGTIVIIAGVTFVITTGGSGALILAPLAL